MKVVIVIPASEKNRYSKNGDLNSWGGTSLLEWKISQAKRVRNISDIFVTTKSKKIRKIALGYGLKVINRDNPDNLLNLYKFNAKKTSSEYILWLNCTSPFLSEKIINNFLKSFLTKKQKYDSAFMYHLDQEYFFRKNEPVNFSKNNMIIERDKVEPLKRISNGAFIFKNSFILRNNKNFGKKPFFYKINWLESLEIKETKNINDLESILSHFEFKQ